MKCTFECPCGDESPDCTYEYCEYCDNDIYSRKLCVKHYFQAYRAGKEKPEKEPYIHPLCSVDGCEQEHHARGYCQRHYNIAKTLGFP